VVEAKLYLYSNYWTRRPGMPFDVSVYEVTKNWEYDEANWHRASDDLMWDAEGANAPSDRSHTAESSTTLNATEQWYSWDVTDLVQKWVTDPALNQGMILVGSGSPLDVGRGVWSSEHSSSSQRPKLMVKYEIPPDVTPLPTSTPTTTLTPTVGPSPTPTPRSVLISRLPFPSAECMCAGESCEEMGIPSWREVWLPWEGEPVWAKLHMYEAGVKCENTILVNGHYIGTSEVWDTGKLCTAAHAVSWDIDPAILTPGMNRIEITDDQEMLYPYGDGTWAATQARLEIAGDLDAPTYEMAQITSSYDGHPHLAMWQVPVSYTGEEEVPLLVSLRWWGDRVHCDDAVYAYGLEANSRGWLLAAPEIRYYASEETKERPHTATHAVQHDIIDLVDMMKERYRVDSSRVYLVGSSMGGMMAATTAAKYPDVFAAVVEQKGATSLGDWYWESEADPALAHYHTEFYKEIGYAPGPAPYSFGYQRQSSQSMAMNLTHVPFAIVHGTADETVAPHHAQRLYDAIGPAYPWVDCYYDADYHTCLCWYEGGHGTPFPYGNAWIFDFLSTYTLNDNPRDLKIRTDETKSYYWLHIAQRGESHTWTYVEANYDPFSGIIHATVNDEHASAKPVEVGFDLDRMGLRSDVSYVVEDWDLNTGEYDLDNVMPVDGQIIVSVPDGNEHRLELYAGSAVPMTERIYQQGYEGYSGVEDTYLDGYDKNANKDGEGSLMLKHDSIYSPLLRFDISDLPPNGVVKSALLDLYVTGWNYSDVSIDARVHKMLTDWVVDEATWNHASTGVEWDAAGAKGSEDRADAAAASCTLDNQEGWVSLDLRSLVQGWIGSPGTNHGITLKGASPHANFYYLASSQHWSQSKHPKLTVKYSMPTPTPSPTLSPTITSTPTSTPTATFTPTPTSEFTPTATATPTSTGSPTSTSTPTPTVTTTPGVGMVQGFVWNDVDGDGQYDLGERMLAGATVVVTDATGHQVGHVVTGIDGVYGVELPAPASYTVTEYDPPGYSSTTPGSWQDYLAAGGSIERNFGDRPNPCFLPVIQKR